MKHYKRLETFPNEGNPVRIADERVKGMTKHKGGRYKIIIKLE